MRPPVLICLLAFAAAASAQDAPRTYPNRIAHGTQFIQPMPQRIKRTDIETSQPVFIVQRDDIAPAVPPPPPSMDDPGPESVEPDVAPAPVGGDGDIVTLRDAVPEAQEKVLPAARAEGATPADEVPVPEKIRPPDEIAPAVTIRTEGDVTVEEYRRDGSVYMVRVVPKKGIAYTYLDTDGDGRLEGDPKEGPMQPVYYTVYEWE